MHIHYLIIDLSLSLCVCPCICLLKKSPFEIYNFSHLNNSKSILLWIICLSHFTQFQDASMLHKPPQDGTNHSKGEDSSIHPLLHPLNPLSQSLHNVNDTSLVSEPRKVILSWPLQKNPHSILCLCLQQIVSVIHLLRCLSLLNLE